jgi:hypothetical protein
MACTPFRTDPPHGGAGGPDAPTAVDVVVDGARVVVLRGLRMDGMPRG